MPPAESPQSAGRNILVVDDEPQIAEAVKMLLECDGHHVTTAGGAQEALAAFAPGKFDVVISDYMMPGMKGDALAAAIRVSAPAQAIVFLTAHAGILENALRLPRVAIVGKPFTLAMLRDAVGRALAAK